MPKLDTEELIKQVKNLVATRKGLAAELNNLDSYAEKIDKLRKNKNGKYNTQKEVRVFIF